MAVVVSCVVPAHQQVDHTARLSGFERALVDGRSFRHVVYKKNAAGSAAPLHVYIEGDGISWRTRYIISSDPTPRNPLMLRLMALDQNASVYVGRPCYLGQVSDAVCDSDDWTYGRFSADVVDSMAQVIRDQSADYPSIVLIGHSGGGALALLLSERLDKTRAVITVAGNLDVAAWTEHHQYTPLYNSIDPASRPALPAYIRQLHLLGGRDDVIPPSLVSDWLVRQPTAEIWRFDQYTHSCCWDQQWPRVLTWMDSLVPGRAHQRQSLTKARVQ